MASSLFHFVTSAAVLWIAAFFMASIQAEEASLGKSIRWRRIMMMAERWIGEPTSLVDDDQFFLSTQGRVDPEAEFVATLGMIRKSLAANDLEYCRFPARYYFIAQSTKEFDPQKVFTCPGIADYLSAVQPVGLSLIFSSYYLNNPSSMMGHSFFRFRKSVDSESSPLLDYALNFSAEPTTDNPLFYAVLGLAGGFAGRFSLLPYYNKVAEYAHFERRDLWEYDLDLNREEVMRVFLSALEVGPHAINYFYADENCSLIMLYILETGRDSLELSQHFQLTVAPTDTVKAVARSGIVTHTHFRPGRFAVFAALYEDLSTELRKLFLRLLDAPQDIDAAVANLSQGDAVKLLDALLAYVEYEEKLVTSQRPVKYAQLYQRCLQLRAQNQGRSQSKVVRDDRLDPTRGHDNFRVGLGARLEKGALFHVVPSMHHYTSAGDGYPPGLGIDVLAATFFADEDSFGIDHFDVVNVVSNQSIASYRWEPSWRLNVAYSRHSEVSDERRPEYKIKGGIGFGGGSQVRSFGLLKVQAGYSPRKGEWSAAAILAPEVQMDLSSHVRLTLEHEEFFWWRLPHDRITSLTASLQWSQNHEFRAKMALKERIAEIELGYWYAFY